MAFRVFFSKNEFRKGREVRPSHATVGGLFQTGNCVRRPGGAGIPQIMVQ